MGAVFKREFKAFFTSPVGYFAMAIVFLFSGLYFTMANLLGRSSSLTTVYDGLFSIVLLLVLPVLSMRLFSEDKRQKTDQALFTAPVSLTGIVLGKFFAALLMFAISISITIVYALVIATQVTPDWMVILGNYIGMLLLGGMILSIGLLISSMTESQFIAAIATFAVSFALMMVDTLSTMVSTIPWLSSAISFLSVAVRYGNFTIGLIQYDNIVFFISMQALFIFLTVRVLDRKRWS